MSAKACTGHRDQTHNADDDELAFHCLQTQASLIPRLTLWTHGTVYRYHVGGEPGNEATHKLEIEEQVAMGLATIDVAYM